MTLSCSHAQLSDSNARSIPLAGDFESRSSSQISLLEGSGPSPRFLFFELHRSFGAMSKARAKGQRAAGTGVSNSARTEAKRDLLVQAIDTWAREELQFKENSLPTPEEFKL